MNSRVNLVQQDVQAGVFYARSVWREAKLIASGAPDSLLKQEQAILRKRRAAVTEHLDSEEMGGAVYAVVLQDAVQSLNGDRPVALLREYMHDCSQILKDRHGYDVVNRHAILTHF